MKRRVQVIKDWRWVLRKAWSVRLMFLAAILSGLEWLLPMLGDFIPKGWFGFLGFIVTVAACAARFLAQRSVEDEHG